MEFSSSFNHKSRLESTKGCSAGNSREFAIAIFFDYSQRQSRTKSFRVENRK